MRSCWGHAEVMLRSTRGPQCCYTVHDNQYGQQSGEQCPFGGPQGGGMGTQGEWAVEDSVCFKVCTMLCTINIHHDGPFPVAATRHANLLCRQKVFFGCSQVCFLRFLMHKAALCSAAVSFCLVHFCLKSKHRLLQSQAVALASQGGERMQGGGQGGA